MPIEVYFTRPAEGNPGEAPKSAPTSPEQLALFKATSLWQSSVMEIWAELHGQAFRRAESPAGSYSTTSAKRALRHLRSAINPLYHNVLKHYNALALPCQVADPEIGAELRRIREAYTRIAREV
jgi:hypothetical protein